MCSNSMWKVPGGSLKERNCKLTSVLSAPPPKFPGSKSGLIYPITEVSAHTAPWKK